MGRDTIEAERRLSRAAPPGDALACLITTVARTATGARTFRDSILPGVITNVVLRRRVRVTQGRNGETSAGIIDSQSVKGADTCRAKPRRRRGQESQRPQAVHRHRPLGLLLIVCVMAASVQGRDGAKTTLLSLYLFTSVRFVYADAGFAGQLVGWCQRILRTVLEIVRKAPDQKGFAVIPRRWVVERSMCATRRSVVSPVQPGGT